MWCKYIILVAAESLWDLGSLFYHGTQNSQWWWFTNLFWCDIPLNKSLHTGPGHTWRSCALCLCCGRELNVDSSEVWWVISLASVGFGCSRVAQYFLPTSLGVGRSWLFPASSIKFLTRRSLKSRWAIYLAPHECNRIELLSTVTSRRWKNNFLVDISTHSGFQCER